MYATRAAARARADVPPAPLYPTRLSWPAVLDTATHCPCRSHCLAFTPHSVGRAAYSAARTRAFRSARPCGSPCLRLCTHAARLAACTPRARHGHGQCTAEHGDGDARAAERVLADRDARVRGYRLSICVCRCVRRRRVHQAPRRLRASVFTPRGSGPQPVSPAALGHTSLLNTFDAARSDTPRP
jgi:hypothetical protein